MVSIRNPPRSSGFAAACLSAFKRHSANKGVMLPSEISEGLCNSKLENSLGLVLAHQKTCLTYARIFSNRKELEEGAMASSTVTSKGQITIPKAIRDRLGLKEGSVLEFVVDEVGQVLLRPRAEDGTDGVYGALRDFAPKRPISVDEMKAVIKARAARKARGKTG